MAGAPEPLDLVEAACAFWFDDNDRVRSPFPRRIQPSLKRRASNALREWLEQVEPTDRRELTDDELASQFELILFREAQELLEGEDTDLVLTLHHPFMPRMGDLVHDATHGPSRIVRRELEQKEDEELYLIVHAVVEGSGEQWMTEFLIPT